VARNGRGRPTLERESKEVSAIKEQEGKRPEEEQLTSERVALAFQTDAGLAYCINLLVQERPDVQFDLPGRRSVIIPKGEQPWFEAQIKARKFGFDRAPVVPASAVPPERLAELRAQYGKPAGQEYADPNWKKSRIAELRKKLGL
jgi:hypothetical protein